MPLHFDDSDSVLVVAAIMVGTSGSTLPVVEINLGGEVFRMTLESSRETARLLLDVADQAEATYRTLMAAPAAPALGGA